MLTPKINHGMLSKVLCEQVSRMGRADCVEVHLIENAGMHLFFIAEKEPPGCVVLESESRKEETRNAYN